MSVLMPSRAKALKTVDLSSTRPANRPASSRPYATKRWRGSDRARNPTAALAADERLALVSVPVHQRARGSLCEALDGKKGGSGSACLKEAVDQASARGEVLKVSFWFVRVAERAGEAEKHAVDYLRGRGMCTLNSDSCPVLPGSGYLYFFKVHV